MSRLPAAHRSRRTPRRRAVTRLSRRHRGRRGLRPSPGRTAGLHAALDVARAGAERRDSRLLGEIPQRAEVGVARVAVVEDDRRVGQKAADEQVPHHPARGREPEDAVLGWASRCRCVCLRCSSRIPPCPWTMPFGRPVVPDEYSTQSGWSNATASKRSSAGRRRAATTEPLPSMLGGLVEVGEEHRVLE